MRSTWLKSTLLLSVLSVSLYACKDKNDPTPVTPPSVGGKGGMATLRVISNNTGNDIDTGMAYIKYDAQVVPANNAYDDSAKIKYVDGTPMAIFTELKDGNYYVFAKGWDLKRSQNVLGGLDYNIPVTSKTGLLYLTLPVRPVK